MKLKSTSATAFAKEGKIHINHESLTELGRKNNLKIKSNEEPYLIEEIWNDMRATCGKK